MRVGVCIVAAFVALAVCGSARAATTSRNIRFTASDGVSLATTVTGQAPLAPRPTIVEFSPYGRASGTFTPGPDYNFLLVQIRGTGDSDGRFDALGDRTQADVAEVLRWACGQPGSDGTLALNGFSASAIMVYNSLHEPLPCVKAAVLKSGTFELYRDLLWPGGIQNLAVGLGVLGLISGPAAEQSPARLQRNPVSSANVAAGLETTALAAGNHPMLDSYWRAHGFRGDVNHLPILMIDGFFDVESRGAFQAYQALRGDGAHLVVIGAHDAAPAGTDAGSGEMAAWFDRYVRGVANGVDTRPRVQLWLADGDREDDLAGKFVRYDGSDWPIPGTTWRSYALDAARSGTAHSINDGTLSPTPPPQSTAQWYPTIPSSPASTDPANTAIVGASGLNAFFSAFPPTTEMSLAEPQGLTYTTAPLTSDVLSAGPADLDLRLSSTAPESNIWAVLSDVAPDGRAHPMTAGRLSTDYPDVDDSQSLHDPATGAIVQPYGVFDHKTKATIGEERVYHVEFWPIGDRFKAGHRLRLEIVGDSAASSPGTPAGDTVRV